MGDRASAGPRREVFAGSIERHSFGLGAAIDQASGNWAGDDIDRQSRPIGPASDIGADEAIEVKILFLRSRRSLTPLRKRARAPHSK